MCIRRNKTADEGAQSHASGGRICVYLRSSAVFWI
jgi:hypothetical protein